MIQTYRTLLVDDERLARNELRSLLAPHSQIEVVGEAESVEGAIEALEPAQARFALFGYSNARRIGI